MYIKKKKIGQKEGLNEMQEKQRYIWVFQTWLFLSLTEKCFELRDLNPNAATATNNIGFIEL